MAKSKSEKLFQFCEIHLNPKSEVRWVILDNFPENLTLRLINVFTQWHAKPVPLYTFEELEKGRVLGELDRTALPVILVDALEMNDRREVAATMKLLLKHFPKHKVVVLGGGALKGLKIPDAFGLGVYFCTEDELRKTSTEFSKDDGPLLKHSRKLSPRYALSDLVLGPKARLKFHEALDYIRTKQRCEYEWGFRERHSRGHGVTLVFHGESGTGKTMAAEVVAKELGLPLYQIDLSSVVSKWVGETEKNLKTIFRAAEGVKGILLFDEGDAIFGQRTQVKGSQDRYSNLEVNYLLQEIEAFDGVVILSTNHEQNMDAAFLRRFTYSITFGKPPQSLREKIWKANVPAKLPLAADVDFAHLGRFTLTGGNIKNCIRDAAARAASKSKRNVDQIDFLWAIKRELQKHNIELPREIVGETFWRKVASEWEYLYYKGGVPTDSKAEIES